MYFTETNDKLEDNDNKTLRSSSIDEQSESQLKVAASSATVTAATKRVHDEEEEGEMPDVNQNHAIAEEKTSKYRDICVVERICAKKKQLLLLVKLLPVI